MKQKITAGICSSLFFMTLVGMEQFEKTERTLNCIFSAKNLISLITQQEKEQKLRVDNINNVLTILQNNCWSEQLESLFFTYYFAPQITLCESNPQKSILKEAFFIHKDVLSLKKGSQEEQEFSENNKTIKWASIDPTDVTKDMHNGLATVMPKLLCLYYLSAALRPEIVNTHMHLSFVPHNPSYLLQSYVFTATLLVPSFYKYDQIVVDNIFYSAQTKSYLSDDIYVEITHWKPDHSTIHFILSGHTGYPIKLLFNNTGRLLASGSSDETIKVWDITSKICVNVLGGDIDRTYALAFSSDNKYLASGGSDRTVRVWQLATNECIAFLIGHKKTIESLLFSSCGNYIFSCSHDTTIKMWNIKKQSCQHAFIGHTDHVYDISINSDFRSYRDDPVLLASASRDATVRIWDTQSYECKAILQTNFPVDFVRFMYHWGLATAVNKEDDITCKNEIQLWNLRTQECVQLLTGLERRITNLFYFPCNQRLVATDSFCKMNVWDIGASAYHNKYLTYYEAVCLNALALPAQWTNSSEPKTNIFPY